jgi:outer membrane immunogenic protein
MLRLGLLGAVSALALTASANAADLYRGPAGGGYKDGPYAPVATWTGFYIGANGGYAWNAGNVGDRIVDTNTEETPPTVTVRLNELDPQGGFGGAQIGYNRQGMLHPRLVLGVEADIQGSAIKDSSSIRFPGIDKRLAAYTYAQEYQINWFGTVRARVGYAFDDTLIYATGGFAYGNVSYKGTAEFDLSNPYRYSPGFTFSKNAIETGYAVGGGIEHQLTLAWSLKAEYQYIHLGDETLHNTYRNEPKFRNAVEYDNGFSTVRLGLNYHIAPSYEPLK